MINEEFWHGVFDNYVVYFVNSGTVVIAAAYLSYADRDGVFMNPLLRCLSMRAT